MSAMSKNTKSLFENFSKWLPLEKLAFSYSQLRTGHYAWQGALLPLIDRVTNPDQRRTEVNFFEHLRAIFPKIEKLYAQDSKNIAAGLYPIEVLAPENPVKHFSRIPLLLIDAVRANLQKRKNQTKKFTPDAELYLGDLPDYYKRNFHFQDSGYLGNNSADLYDHQVEVLFSGTADAMRRLMVPPLKNHFSSSDGQGLHFLELGCGTGRLTRFVALAFPKAKITIVDLSPFYLKLASKRLSAFKNINYIQGAAEHLDFKDQTFDAIYSGYLFHELPDQVRLQVHTESFRLLKSRGIYGLLDSLQKDDDKELNWALDRFPKDFHEPFYKNYTLKPIDKQLLKSGFKKPSTRIGFLTKVVTAVRP